MNPLSHDWLTEGIIDFEYKKYVLLAYLKNIKKQFNKTQLYPFLAELVFHYQNLQKLKSDKELLFESFPKSIKKADLERLRFSYERIAKDDEAMRQIQEIIVYAIPRIDATIQEGKELFEFVQENLELQPVGLVPLYKQEGYLLVNQDGVRDVDVYRYASTVFESTQEQYRGLSTAFIGKRQRSLAWSFETIKLELVRCFRDLPNPATFVVQSKLIFPMENTLLPVAKRMLMQQLAA